MLLNSAAESERTSERMVVLENGRESIVSIQSAVHRRRYFADTFLVGAISNYHRILIGQRDYD